MVYSCVLNIMAGPRDGVQLCVESHGPKDGL